MYPNILIIRYVRLFPKCCANHLKTVIMEGRQACRKAWNILLFFIQYLSSILHHPFLSGTINQPSTKLWLQGQSFGTGNEMRVLLQMSIIKNDVINNNKDLDQHPLFRGYMHHHCNFSKKLEMGTPECNSTDNPSFDSPDSLHKKENGSSSERRNAYWTESQEQFFLRFWMEKLIEMPLNSYSFDAPLKRSHHFQELSQFMSVHLAPQPGKASQQCKSKFATIRRKIHREKVRGKRGEKYGFTDYIIEEGIKTAKDPDTLALLRRLQGMHGTDSEFMAITKRIMDMERKEMELKNNNIYTYLMELDRLP